MKLRHYPLLPSAAALILGIAAGRLSRFFPLTTAVIALACLVVLLLMKQIAFPQRIAAAAFFAAGIAAFYTYGPGAPSPVTGLVDKGAVRLNCEVVRPPQEREGYTVLFVRPDLAPSPGLWGLVGRAGLVRLTVKGTGHGIGYGDVLTGEFDLGPPVGFRNPGTFDWGEYAGLNGVDAVSYVRPEELGRVGNRAGYFLMRLYSFRQALIERSKASLPSPASELFRSMVLGDQGGVGQEMRDDFAASGTTHILSVSGSHMALLAGLIFLLTRWLLLLPPRPYDIRLSRLLDCRKAAAVAAIAASTLYCLLAGSEVATVRSLIMIVVFLAAVLLSREAELMNALSAAAIIVLALNPASLFDVSFQLSYGSVLFMALTTRGPIGRAGPVEGERPAGAMRRGVLTTLLMSLAVMVGTAPLVAMDFNSFSYIALPANLVIIPLAGAVAVPVGLLSCLIYAVHPAQALPLAGLNSFILDFFYSVVHIFASAPSANLHPPAPGIAVAALFYVSVAALLTWQAGRARTGAAVLAGLTALAAVVPMPALGEGRLRVSFLDVGQGDSALIEFPGGQVMLVDGGGNPRGMDPGRAAVAPYLWNHGIRRLDYVVITHPHPDHLQGLVYILLNFEVGQVWEGGLEGDSEGYRRLREVIAEKGVPRYLVSRRGELQVGLTKLQVLHTAYDFVDDADKPKGDRENNRSLVIRLNYKETSFLFTGDIDREAEDAMVGERPPLPLKSTVLKVPHHGSPRSSGGAFYGAVSPLAAVISVGRRNRYGHPSQDTLTELAGLGARTCRTDKDGAVVFTTDGKALETRIYEDYSLTKARSLSDEMMNYRKLGM